MVKSHLALFGRARIQSEDGDIALEKKAAACIALLAWEGPTARARIGDLLWPNAGSETQRANLRQLARRLKLALGCDVVSSGDPLMLDLGVDVDLRQFQSWSASNDWRNVALVRGPLLAGMSFDDCPELEEWLGLIRTRVNWTLAHALAAESARIEKSAGPRDAIPHVLHWLELDPTSEDAYRRLMRLHYAVGERGAALGAYDTCRTVLRRMLDVSPSPATVNLARQIRGSPSGMTPKVTIPRRQIPLSVLRPPLLVGREKAFAALEEAMRGAKLAFITGPAGIGKTRLVQDFAAAHPEYVARYIGCRPTDRDLPYAYFARTWRHDLALYPERARMMEPWVRRELGRILPELGPAPPPITNAEERTRFFDANLEMAKANDETLMVLSDDAHHLDSASHELGVYLAMYFIGKQSPLRSISTYRFDELAAEPRTLLEAVCDAGEGIRVDLMPLSEPDLAELLRSMEVAHLADQADVLHAFTGGNPFYFVETVRALFDNGDPKSLPDALTASDRVRLTIERALGLLPVASLELLRAAAVLDEPLTFSLAEGMIEGPRDRVGVAWADLESRLLLRGGSVAHELLRMVVLDSMPHATRALLHRGAAATFMRLGAHPARIALHWERAGEVERASQCYEKAARLSRQMMRKVEEAAFLAKAEEVLSQRKPEPT